MVAFLYRSDTYRSIQDQCDWMDGTLPQMFLVTSLAVCTNQGHELLGNTGE